MAKGNERLPFAWRAILCEGQDDMEARMTLTERMGIDLRAAISRSPTVAAATTSPTTFGSARSSA